MIKSSLAAYSESRFSEVVDYMLTCVWLSSLLRRTSREWGGRLDPHFDCNNPLLAQLV
jgi:hypothetical protein